MSRRGITFVGFILVCTALLIAGCGRALPTAKQIAQASGGGPAGAGVGANLSPITDPPTKDITKPVVWATYRMVQTIDPTQAFDYPENTVDTTLYDSLLRQNPDGTISPGVAVATYPSPTELILTIRPGVKFWDGDPVTSADVVYDLKRAASPASFYGAVFDRVKSIVADGTNQVILRLKRPDNWLYGELSEMAGVVYQKSYAEREGKNFGTPQGLTMGTGPYEVKKWVPGQEFVETANPHYWDSTVAPRVKEIIFKGIGDDESLTAGLETGAVDGTYDPGLSTLPVLQKNPNLTVSFGPSYDIDAMIIDNLKGVLGNVKVRQAISMAINRESYIQAVYHGHAQLPRTLETPGEWGYGQPVFEKDWEHLPAPTQNIAKAKALIKQAHAEGKSFTIGTTQQNFQTATAANVVDQAATDIGLHVKLVSVSSDVYVNFFESKSARKGIDMFPTTDYPDYADPAGLYSSFVMKGQVEDYDGFNNPLMTKYLNMARNAPNPDLQAHYTALTGDLIAKDLPWIGLAAPDNMVVTQKWLTGEPTSFTYMGGPWANLMGGR
jgi:peptide/nickel transport system substrate-binding protein